MFAEHHQHLVQLDALFNSFENNGWQATASAARPTERSDKGTTAGVLVAIKNHIDNRPAAICQDTEGRITKNGQLTARLIVLANTEMLLMAGYLECALGFVGPNHCFLIAFCYKCSN